MIRSCICSSVDGLLAIWGGGEGLRYSVNRLHDIRRQQVMEAILGQTGYSKKKRAIRTVKESS
jgi:hypothetical protein